MCVSVWSDMTDEHSIYSVHKRDGAVATIEVRRVHSIQVDEDPVCRHYNSVEELPQWIQEKLSVLSVMCAADASVETYITGVGVRISPRDFWVFRKEEYENESN